VSGLSWVTGHADGPPLVPGGMGDPLQAIHAAFGMIAALEYRDSIGRGFQLEIPMVEVALNVTAEQVIEWSRNGVLLTRMGNRGPGAAPQGLYACRENRLVAIAVENDAQWSAMVVTLGLPKWAQELRTSTERRTHHAELDALLAQEFATRDVDQIVGSLLARRVPAGPVDPGGQLDSHPQLMSRRFFEPIDQPIVGRHEFPGWPSGRDSWRLPWFAGPAPLLGQHNHDVLTRELCLGDDEIARLEADLVVGRHPLGLV
jgi:crotonobetainyl-CoA:carnitine CoA-transferase CaiB-like acyl-CoA transferase